MKLGTWNQSEVLENFEKYYVRDESRIIVIDGRDAGWMQVAETSDDIELVQLHILEMYRNQGIGTRLITDLLARANREGKTMSLSVIRSNRAQELYRRIGFIVIDEEPAKLHLRWVGANIP